MLKHIPLLIAGGVLVAAGGIFGATQAFAKDITLVVDGQQQQVRTWDNTVADVLKTKGIQVGEHDVVTPAPEEKLQPKDEVTVSYGRELRVKINGEERRHWTTATTVNDALAALSLREAATAKLSVSRSATIGRDGLSFELVTPFTVTILAAGKPLTVEASGTVADALSAAKLDADGDDVVTPRPTTPLSQGAKITFVKVTTKKVTETKAVPFTVTSTNDATLAAGTTKVITPGVEGKVSTEYLVTSHDGKVKSKKALREISRTAPVAQVVKTGTKAVAKPDASTSGKGTINWDKLAQCEAGGNWSINTGNGYYGGLQFSAQTWEGFGGTKFAARADLATKAQQIEIGEKVLKSQGLNAWPGCTAKGMY